MWQKNVNAKKIKSNIFNKNINNNYKLIPFNVSLSTTGETKYFPPSSKEWKNSVYFYNQNTIKNFPVLDSSIYKIIKNYFNLYFNPKFIFNKLNSQSNNVRKFRFRAKSYNKVFVSKPEIKHTNSKALITIYTYNKQGKSLLKKIRILKISYIIDIFHIIKLKTMFKGEVSTLLIKIFKFLLFKELILIRRLKLKLNLNKYKFEEKFLYKLSKLISRFYNKKVVFNIVNLKSVMFNSDIFTEILTSKLRNNKARPMNLINIFFNKAKLPNVNRIIERTRIVKNVNFDLISNKFRDININNIITEENNLDNVLKDIYHNVVFNPIADLNSKNYINIYNTIFNSINYKNTNGVRLEVKGRLTRRYRADRAVYKLKWKGGLRNIDSSYKGLSSVNYRGSTLPNVEYSINTSKRRIGAFAVKGWISGK